MIHCRVILVIAPSWLWMVTAKRLNIFDYMLKVLVIGNSAVGKTSILVRYTEKTFQEAYVSTVGIDFKVKTLHRNGKKIKLQV